MPADGEVQMASDDTIAAQVAKFQAGLPPRPEGDPPGPFELDRARLVANGLPANLLRVGSMISDVDLVDVNGDGKTLYSALGNRTSVVVLYRGEWSPYCSIALRTYERVLVPALGKFDAQLIAISPQRPDGSLATKEKNGLSFAVFSDRGNQLARQFGVVVTPSAAALELRRSRGIDLAERNADRTADVPMPTVAIIDTDYVLRFIDVHPDYQKRTEPLDVIDAIAAL
jgi:peroxiredoxin